MMISRVNGQQRRLILTGMITDQVVCSRIAALKKNGESLFRQQWADIVANWCIDYIRKYDTPPGVNIQQIFHEWIENEAADKETITLMEKFLSYLSKEFEEDSPKSSEYILDVAKNHFNSIHLYHIIKDANEELEEGNWEEAQNMLLSMQKIDLGNGSTIILDQEFEPWRNAIERTGRGLIKYPEELETFFGDTLSRDSLYAFMGVDKSGKSFWLLDLAYRAIKQRRRVVYFEVGDMGEEDTILRLAQRIVSRPEYSCDTDYPIGFDSDRKPIIKRRSFDGVSIQEAFKKLKKYTQGSGKFRLSCYPNSSVNVQTLSSKIRDWIREDWVPDVVVIDYADILAPPAGEKDPLVQIDETWKQLRRMSQEFHCLVVTATQTSAAAYGNQNVLTRKHFSGRKTKLAHVNGMIGLNVSPEDKKNGVTRLNWIVRRRGRWNENSQLHVAGNLEIARPCIISTW